MTAEPTGISDGVSLLHEDDPNLHILLLQDAEEAAELMSLPAPALEAEAEMETGVSTTSDPPDKEAAKASPNKESGQPDKPIVRPGTTNSTADSQASKMTAVADNTTTTATTLGGQESGETPKATKLGTPGRGTVPPVHYYPPGYGARPPHYYGPPPPSPYAANPAGQPQQKAGEGAKPNPPPPPYPYHHPYGYPYYSYTPYPPALQVRGGAATRASVTPSSSSPHPTAAPWSPPNKTTSDSKTPKTTASPGHYFPYPSPYPYSPAGGYYPPPPYAYPAPPSYDPLLPSPPLTPTPSTLEAVSASKSGDIPESSPVTNKDGANDEAKPNHDTSKKPDSLEDPQTPTRIAPTDEDALLLSPPKPGWLSPRQTSGNAYGGYPPNPYYYYPYHPAPAGASFYDYPPPPPPDGHSGVSGFPYPFPIAPYPGAPATAIDTTIQTTSSSVSSTRDNHRRTTKNNLARQRAAVLREKLEVIEKKSPDERTAEETTLWEQNEQRRTAKNQRSRSRAQQKKDDLDCILATPKASRTPEQVQFLEQHMAAKERKLEGDKLRRKRLKELGWSSSGKKKAKTKSLRITARGPLPPEAKALIACQQQQQQQHEGATL